VLALPLAVGSVAAYQPREAAESHALYACVQAINGGASFNAQVVDEAGEVYVALEAYRTVPLPGPAPA
jgi:hypothetical protein